MSDVLDPIHILVGPAYAMTGLPLMVTGRLASDTHSVIASTKVNVACPGATPKTTPKLETDAIEELLLVQLPPEAGNKVVVVPAQIVFEPEIEITGLDLTVITCDESDVHPVEVCIKINLAVPADIPVTTPLFVIVATPGLELIQLPPDAGKKFVTAPIQIEPLPESTMVGLPLIVTGADGLETQPEDCVKVNVATPWVRPVTKPALLILATNGLLLIQVPPEDGNSCVVLPTQIVDDPDIEISGLVLTLTISLGGDVHPVEISVNTNLAVPFDTPVTIPALLTTATDGFVLDHIPPVAGDKVVVAPGHIDVEPVTMAFFPRTVTELEGSDIHPC